jgi:hypothetical protein
MGWTFSSHWVPFVLNLVSKLKNGEYSEEEGEDGCIILKCTLRKYYWTVLTEVIWLKLGTVEGLCKHDD